MKQTAYNRVAVAYEYWPNKQYGSCRYSYHSQPHKKVEQFQVILAGSEIGNGYSGLNDPLDQAKRFEEQRKLKEAGDKEAQDYDESFVEALKYGMPPACGFGVSERLFACLMDKPIRECVIFPLMKPWNTKN